MQTLNTVPGRLHSMSGWYAQCRVPGSPLLPARTACTRVHREQHSEQGLAEPFPQLFLKSRKLTKALPGLPIPGNL